MSNLDPIYMEGDKVFYVGSKFKMDLTSKEGKPYVGLIHARVENEPGVFVVEFPDTKEGDSYVMSERVLSKYKPARVERHDGPEVQTRARRKKEAE